MVCIAYDRSQLKTFSVFYDVFEGAIGVQGSTSRQTVKSVCGKYDIVFEISADGLLVENPIFNATESVTVSMNNKTLYTAVFSTKIDGSFRTLSGVWYDCSGCNKKVLNTTSSSIGKLSFGCK